MWATITTWYIIIGLVLTVIFTLCVLVGGAFDLVSMLKELMRMEADETDDGRVSTESDL